MAGQLVSLPCKRCGAVVGVVPLGEVPAQQRMMATALLGGSLDGARLTALLGLHCTTCIPVPSP